MVIKQTISLVDLPLLTPSTCAPIYPVSGPSPPTVTVTLIVTKTHVAPVDLCRAVDVMYEKGWEARSDAGRLGFGRLGFGRLGFGRLGFERLGFEKLGFGRLRAERRCGGEDCLEWVGEGYTRH